VSKLAKYDILCKSET